MEVEAEVHATAEVADTATVGRGTFVWNNAQIRDGAHVGEQCIVGKDVYIDVGVRIGDRVKIQNGASLFRGTTIGDGVFVGPGAILANDRYPRAITPDGALKGPSDWSVSPVNVELGASIGAGAIVLPGARVGAFSMLAAGAVLTADAPSYALMAGVPARLIGGVCCCGRPATKVRTGAGFTCAHCGRTHSIGEEA